MFVAVPFKLQRCEIMIVSRTPVTPHLVPLLLGEEQGEG